MKTLPIFLMLIIFADGSLPAQDKVHEWPQYRGNSGFTGVSTDDSVKPPLKLLWSYRLDGDASGDAGAGVVVGGGKVFVNIHNTKSIVALNAETGRFEWEYKETSVGYRTVPTFNDGRLFLWQRGQTKQYAVLALDAASGKVLWQKPVSAHNSDVERIGLPVDGGLVFCSEGGDEPAVLAFNTKTGEQVWRTSLGKEDGLCVNGPTAVGGKVFVATLSSHGWRAAQQGAVIALDAANGKEIWRRQNLMPNRSLVSDGESVVCTSYAKDDTKSYLLDAKTGKTIWNGPARFHYNPATITKDLVLIRPYGADCYGLDRETGKERWKLQMPKVASGCCAPAVSGQYAYFGTGVINPGDLESLAAFQHLSPSRELGISGTMHAIDLKTGKPVWQFGTANCICGDPALAYGKLYFHSRDGNVYCFIPAKNGEPTTPDAKDEGPSVSVETVAKLLEPKQMDEPRSGKDWPMQGGSPDRAGLTFPAFNQPLEVAWKFNIGDRIVGAAAIRDGKAFVGSDNGKIVAVDLKTGIKVWVFQTGAKIRCSPAVVGGLVYCGSDDAHFYALDAESGMKRWSFECGGPVQASPVVVGGIVLFGANDHHVYARDRLTGKKLWSHRVNDYCILAPPVVHGDVVYVGQWTDWVRALDIKTGKMLWQSIVPVTIESLAYYRDKLYVRNPNWMIELDPKTGKRLRIGAASWGWGGVAFVKNQMFLTGIQSQYGTSGATATDLDEPSTPTNRKIPTLEDVGALKPKSIKGSPDLAGMGTPLAIGETLCFVSAAGKVAITDLDGTKRWTFQLGGTSHASPVAADGVLIVGCDDGHLYAFREKK